MRKLKQLGYFILPALILLASCEENPLKIDTEEVKVPQFEIVRLEQDLFALNQSNFDQKFVEMQRKYGIVFEHFLMNPFRLNGSKDTACRAELLRFVSDRDVRGAYEQSQLLYSNFDEIQAEVDAMRKRFHHHFPEYPLPAKLITVQSGWNYAVAYMDSTLLLSLDMYLGDTSQYYQMLRYPLYQVRKMNRHFMLSDLARGWVLTEFDNDKAKNTLLDHTIFYGKLFYAVQALLPEAPDSIVIGYSSKQIETCLQYEKQYWGYFAEKNRLFENSLQTIRELTSEGPFTAAISKDCPPRIAMWIGWRIVQSYMKTNKKTLQELMAETDAQKILSKSKYRP